ncbi:hypothetical protein VHEMI05682 [[Torrubiella] hemipterigena]|uniref:Uncharacterized protein n=1 Tax=[Torrubiella] hemipterigena TaxID=1531966 RepID=A0A0A1TH83_9HYPO|nr:hypothetical protein VHEMI05682 [[Torrubiella] hemipterigena]
MKSVYTLVTLLTGLVVATPIAQPEAEQALRKTACLCRINNGSGGFFVSLGHCGDCTTQELAYCFTASAEGTVCNED